MYLHTETVIENEAGIGWIIDGSGLENSKIFIYMDWNASLSELEFASVKTNNKNNAPQIK